MSGEQIFTIYIWFFQTIGMFLSALDEVVFFQYGAIQLTCLGFFLTILNYKLLMWFIIRIIKGKNTDNDLIDEKEYYGRN